MAIPPNTENVSGENDPCSISFCNLCTDASRSPVLNKPFLHRRNTGDLSPGSRPHHTKWSLTLDRDKFTLKCHIVLKLAVKQSILNLHDRL